MIHVSSWLIAGALVTIVVLFVAGNVAWTAVNALNTPGYWMADMREPVQPNAIRLVALGDSSVQAIGASNPMDGYVGRIATYVHEKTGRPVHIANVATGGSITDIVTSQLAKVELSTADIVVVADDNLNGMSLDKYRATLEALAAAVPADRTVISDLPGLPGEDRYQPVLTEVADAHGILRADVKSILNGEGRRLDIFSWLPPHLNSKGYGYWFEAFRPKIDVILARQAVRQEARA
jgi:lysophospholipase L1-like esterase